MRLNVFLKSNAQIVFEFSATPQRRIAVDERMRACDEPQPVHEATAFAEDGEGDEEASKFKSPRVGLLHDEGEDGAEGDDARATPDRPAFTPTNSEASCGQDSAELPWRHASTFWRQREWR